MSGKSAVSLYFHIPFCKKKCDYCHFYVIPERESHKSDLMEGLRVEWSLRRKDLLGKQVTSIYFGGGTPSLLGPGRISEILSWIEVEKSAEVTLEANPDDITLEVMKEYAAAGINRVSVGVQSLDDTLLRTLSRQHDSQKAIDAVYAVTGAGITNISIDLMYDIPGQTLEVWERTLDRALELPITHLSLYNLVFEPQTVFFKKRSQLQPLLPNDVTSVEMYRMAVEHCSSKNLKQYEISAFAKEGCRSFHNIGYWQGRPFLGFGPSAFSYWEGKRFRNVAHLGRYCNALKCGELSVDFEEELVGERRQGELLAIRLRMLEGVDLKEFGPLSEERQKSLRGLEEDELLFRDGSRLKLTEKGILFYDTVATELV